MDTFHRGQTWIKIASTERSNNLRLHCSRDKPLANSDVRCEILGGIIRLVKLLLNISINIIIPV